MARQFGVGPVGRARADHRRSASTVGADIEQRERNVNEGSSGPHLACGRNGCAGWARPSGWSGGAHDCAADFDYDPVWPGRIRFRRRRVQEITDTVMEALGDLETALTRADILEALEAAEGGIASLNLLIREERTNWLF